MKKSSLEYKRGPPMICQNCGQDAYYCDRCGEDFVNNQKIICKEAGASQHFCRGCYSLSVAKRGKHGN